MQEIWISGVKWDEQIRDEEFNVWKAWLQNLTKITECKVPRFYSYNYLFENEISLQVFCDASKKAYSAVAYWRFSTPDESSIHVSFIAAKSRVSPVKPMSIPCLELQAAVLACRLAKSIEQEHEFKITRRVFWSDSSTVLHWLKSDPRSQSIFVAHRLGEIQECTILSEWRWVPSKSNPADDATKKNDAIFYSDSRWFKGPAFLGKPTAEWPVGKFTHTAESLESLESENVAVFVAKIREKRETAHLPNYERFSKWERLLRTTARVLSSIERLRRQSDGEISMANIKSAESLWIREIQASCFESEIISIKKGESLNINSKLNNLTPIIDKDGILRANGRLRNLPDNLFESYNYPIILELSHYVTRLIVNYYHEKFKHGSYETVINEIRQKYWIAGLRSALKSISHKCVICRKLRMNPLNPLMADLPPGRLAFKQRPFSHCGMDYFGPM